VITSMGEISPAITQSLHCDPRVRKGFKIAKMGLENMFGIGGVHSEEPRRAVEMPTQQRGSRKGSQRKWSVPLLALSDGLNDLFHTSTNNLLLGS
jgi:hypothetical protein